MLEDVEARKVVEAVLAHLLALQGSHAHDAALGDIGWLQRRCEDTLGVHGGDECWCNLSLLQLKKDVAAFNEEFPGLLDAHLVLALQES